MIESWFEISLEATRWLQNNYPQLLAFMTFISDIGRFEFYLAIMPLIYWCIDKRLGKHLTYLLAFADIINRTLKHTVRGPRPFWLDESLGLGLETGYGAPSGHVQTATVFYLGLAAWVRERWAWLVGGLMVLLMMVSRIYLGDHFVHDTIISLLIGLLILVGYRIWLRRLESKFDNRILGQRLLVVVSVPLAIAAVYLLLFLILPAPRPAAGSESFIAQVELESMEDMATAFGTLLGLGIGFVLEGSWVRFLVSGSAPKRAARYLLGMVVTLIIWRGLGIAFAPIELLWLALPLRIMRYLLLGLWAAYYAPALFVRLGLAEAEPAPQMTMRLQT